MAVIKLRKKIRRPGHLGLIYNQTDTDDDGGSPAKPIIQLTKDFSIDVTKYVNHPWFVGVTVGFIRRGGATGTPQFTVQGDPEWRDEDGLADFDKPVTFYSQNHFGNSLITPVNPVALATSTYTFAPHDRNQTPEATEVELRAIFNAYQHIRVNYNKNDVSAGSLWEMSLHFTYANTDLPPDGPDLDP